MKKKILFVLLVCVLVFTSGCGKTKKTITCNSESRDDVSGYNFYTEHKIKTEDDMVVEITTTETMDFDEGAYNDNTINDAKASFVDFYSAQNNVYGGYDNSVKVDGKKVISTTVLDFDKIDMDKFLSDNVVLKEYANEEKQIKDTGFIELYKSLGATCDNK